MWMALELQSDEFYSSHSYGSKHICCWFSDSHSASGVQRDSLTERRRNSEDKKERWTQVSSTVVVRITMREKKTLMSTKT